MFALLKPTFSLPLRPPLLARVLPSKAERSPTDAFLHPTASGRSLSPVHLRQARALESVSYYALFRVAASRQTPGCLCTPLPPLSLSGHLGP
ncbi:Photosystem II CP47 reaction center protein [Quillaja saponaria]|uniref:Photosystem II CP47 reaction center protein n=1 Tax=Quillaja saponaria TaxID=32244 RepID=A0AAD7P438_QUISA|nr:Photosystem II CP47 reaction center protein [Quillaja saponaria]